MPKSKGGGASGRRGRTPKVTGAQRTAASSRTAAREKMSYSTQAQRAAAQPKGRVAITTTTTRPKPSKNPFNVLDDVKKGRYGG